MEVSKERSMSGLQVLVDGFAKVIIEYCNQQFDKYHKPTIEMSILDGEDLPHMFTELRRAIDSIDKKPMGPAPRKPHLDFLYDVFCKFRTLIQNKETTLTSEAEWNKFSDELILVIDNLQALKEGKSPKVSFDFDEKAYELLNLHARTGLYASGKLGDLGTSVENAILAYFEHCRQDPSKLAPGAIESRIFKLIDPLKVDMRVTRLETEVQELKETVARLIEALPKDIQEIVSPKADAGVDIKALQAVVRKLQAELDALKAKAAKTSAGGLLGLTGFFGVGAMDEASTKAADIPGEDKASGGVAAVEPTKAAEEDKRYHGVADEPTCASRLDI